MTERAEFQNPEASNEPLTTEELQKILELQGSILGDAVTSDDHQGLLAKLCSLAESFTPNSVATVMLFEPGKESLYVESAPSLNEEGFRAFNGLKVGEGSCGNAVYHGEPMYVCNVRTDARWQKLVHVAERFNIWACWAFPVRDENGEPVGSFAISSFEERRPESFHRTLLQVCASVVEVILARKAHAAARENWFNEQLKAGKLESLGVLAGGIAHDFNNLLGSILGNIDLASVALPENSKPARHLAQAQLATVRARDLTQQLLTFSRGGDPVKRPHDIKAVIRESADFALQGSDVKLDFSSDPAPMKLEFDSGQIGQAIQNLVINARQSMQSGGTIGISLERVAADSMARFGDVKGNFLCIRISDSGSGIPANIIDRIFDPYFTTKSDGTGLGLAVTHSIVRKHSGFIDVRSKPNVGTEFTIYLPAPMLAAVAESDHPVASQFDRSSGIALIVDDDELLRATAGEMMRHIGYEVWEADSGTRALELHRQARRNGQSIDITIMDLTMPGDLNGIEAMSQLRAADPEAIVIVSSGYAAGPVMANYLEYGFRGAVAKPYNLRDLRAVVSKVLQDASASDTNVAVRR